MTEALDLEEVEGEVRHGLTAPLAPACLSFPVSQEFALIWDLWEALLHPRVIFLDLKQGKEAFPKLGETLYRTRVQAGLSQHLAFSTGKFITRKADAPLREWPMF